MRIAFLTTEFPINNITGGLGNYLSKTCSLLADRGWEIEVFLLGDMSRSISVKKGVVVHEVPLYSNWFVSFLLKFFSIRIFHFYMPSFRALLVSYSLARALRSQHRIEPIQIAQCPNNYGMGIWVKLITNVPLVVRLSSDRKLWATADKSFTFSQRLRYSLELLSIRLAKRVYAPSKFLAFHYTRYHKINVSVVRPPLGQIKISDAQDLTLPLKYFVHVGQLGPRKGTDLVLKMMTELWKTIPGAKLVMVGDFLKNEDKVSYFKEIAAYQESVIWLNRCSHEQTIFIIKNAIASVLPSRVDNLPNVALESLYLGVPVFGLTNSSVDEVVESGINGEIEDEQNINRLTMKLEQVWRTPDMYSKDDIRNNSILSSFENDKAIDNLITLYKELI